MPQSVTNQAAAAQALPNKLINAVGDKGDAAMSAMQTKFVHALNTAIDQRRTDAASQAQSDKVADRLREAKQRRQDDTSDPTPSVVPAQQPSQAATSDAPKDKTSDKDTGAKADADATAKADATATAATDPAKPADQTPEAALAAAANAAGAAAEKAITSADLAKLTIQATQAAKTQAIATALAPGATTGADPMSTPSALAAQATTQGSRDELTKGLSTTAKKQGEALAADLKDVGSDKGLKISVTHGDPLKPDPANANGGNSDAEKHDTPLLSTALTIAAQHAANAGDDTNAFAANLPDGSAAANPAQNMPVVPGVMTGGATQAVAVNTANHSPGGSSVTIPIDQVAVHVARAAGAGLSELRIQLNPGDLGKIEVKLNVGDDGRVQATISADRRDTLDLLQRDQRGMERALQDAGLKTGDNSLNFSLRGDSQNDGRFAGSSNGNSSNGGGQNAALALDEADLVPAAVPAAYRSLPAGAIDIRV